MREFIDSFAKHIGKRAKSQLYGVFGFWWIIFHWSFFYSLILLDQNLVIKETGLLKDVYLKQTYFNYKTGRFWFDFLMPFVMTYLTVQWLPKLVIWAYRKEKTDEYDRQVIKVTHDKKVERLITELEERRIKTLDKAEERVEKEQKVENLETQEWRKEYEALKGTAFYGQFQKIIEAVYKYRGQVKAVWNTQAGYYQFEVPVRILTFAHTNNIIQFDKDSGDGGVIQLTDKGKFFVRQYTLDTESQA